MTLQFPMFPPFLPAGALSCKPSSTTPGTTKRPPRKKRTPDAPAPKPHLPGLHYPVMTPEEMFEQLGKLRQEAEVVIDRLINIVDRIDAASEDMEHDGAGEPGLGSSNSLNQERWCTRGSSDDLEQEFDGREDGGDDEDGADHEPILGASEPIEPEPGTGGVWFGKWSRFTKAEREQVYNQRNWAHGSSDLEAGDDAEQENVRTDPAKIAKARERVRVG